MNEDLALFIAPLTLVPGAGLFAAGVLSFLGVHFFKSAFAERAALAAGLALIVLTEFIFATSSMSRRFLNGQRADAIECRLEAETSLPYERREDSPLIREHVLSCMSRFGYEWSAERARCQEGPAAANPFCYLPQKLFDRAVTEFQMKFE